MSCMHFHVVILKTASYIPISFVRYMLIGMWAILETMLLFQSSLELAIANCMQRYNHQELELKHGQTDRKAAVTGGFP